jgi:hypothetical protein
VESYPNASSDVQQAFHLDPNAYYVAIVGYRSLAHLITKAGLDIAEDEAFRNLEQCFGNVLDHLRSAIETLDAVLAEAGLPEGARGDAYPPTFLTCLTEGVSQRLARVALEKGFAIGAIIPCRGYGSDMQTNDRELYEWLRSKAKLHVYLDNSDCGTEAIEIATRRMLDMADTVIAVWDGHVYAQDDDNVLAAVEYSARTYRDLIFINPLTLDVVP